jgi:crossover junction endodeoxyribonuclease RuvC
MDGNQEILRVLGVDPGLNVSGYGVIDMDTSAVRLVEAGVIRSSSGASLTTRIGQIYDGIVEVVRAYQPGALALEELYSHYDRPRTAILMGHARGAICLAACQANMVVHHYASTRVKNLLTGNGRAPKTQMQFAIQREFGLAEPPQPHDVADALAVALCHVFSTRMDSVTTLCGRRGV